jgi:hypothetical protein
MSWFSRKVDSTPEKTLPTFEEVQAALGYPPVEPVSKEQQEKEHQEYLQRASASEAREVGYFTQHLKK